MSLAQRIYNAAHLQGEFLLRSGEESDEYFDKYLFESDPVLLREIAQALAALIPDDAQALAGLELGGVPIVTMLSQVTGLPALFVRKRAKDYGTMRLAEGGEVDGRRLVIVEDVVTTGGQISESAGELRARGALITTVLCVIDRECGGAQNLIERGLELRALFGISELTAAV